MDIKFSFKGALILVLGIYIVNFLAPLTSNLLNLDQGNVVVIANTFISAAVVTFILTRVDGPYKGVRHAIRLYAFIALMFFVLTSLWVSGIIA